MHVNSPDSLIGLFLVENADRRSQGIYEIDRKKGLRGREDVVEITRQSAISSHLFTFVFLCAIHLPVFSPPPGTSTGRHHLASP